MSEEVTHRNVGYSWSITIKNTVREPGRDPKYADVKEIEATLAGNADNKEDQQSSLLSAKSKLEEVIKI